jgi:DNA polymerase-3 subunit gamma/tau
MAVRIIEHHETKRTYGRVEQFQMMGQKNPVLLKLKETFGLELN